MACVLKRRPCAALTLISALVLLVVFHLKSEEFEGNILGLLNHLGWSSTKRFPFFEQTRHPTRHKGYINVKTHEPLHLDCDQCAVVSNSGQMIGQKVGKEIDQSSCIWRMNNAPVTGYEDDVGRRTSIRVVSHTSVPLLLQNPDYFFKETNTTIYVIWGPYRNMRMDGKGIVYSMLKKAAANYPDANIYLTTEQQMNHCDDVFKMETGRDRVQSGTYLSTGWFTLILAMKACNGIHVFGMINDTYCNSEGFRNVPYHYYEEGRSECEEYLLHENAPYGGHRFITEKKVFSKWAKEHAIIFSHPNWTVF